MPASRNPVVFVHGYSDQGASWLPWREILRERLGLQNDDLRTCTYVSLNNEVTIPDIAEAFDRALSTQGGLQPDQPFDAMVHSTGMLVVRAWLAADPLRTKRLKRLIALAPATFGSPLAKQGRSWLGSIFKGNKHLGPDFLNAGNRVLEQLELASAFSWRLAESDILTRPSRYDNGPDTPFVFVFCGTGTYRGLREIVNKPGTDGTVRRAGCGMNVRRMALDLTEKGIVARREKPELAGTAELKPHQRILADDWLLTDIPVHFVSDRDAPGGVNHATILSAPPAELQELVVSAFQMTGAGRDGGSSPGQGYTDWLRQADAVARFGQLKQQYQQFIVHAVDDRGDPITDYNVQLFRTSDVENRIDEFDAEVDIYSGDASYRCFHVDVASLLPKSGESGPGLSIRLIASSGTTYVGYLGYGFEEQAEPGSWDASLTFDGPELERFQFFHPYTTTLIRLYIERQVLPPDRTLPSTLLIWDALPGPQTTEKPLSNVISGPAESKDKQ